MCFRPCRTVVMSTESLCRTAEAEQNRSDPHFERNSASPPPISTLPLVRVISRTRLRDSAAPAPRSENRIRAVGIRRRRDGYGTIWSVSGYALPTADMQLSKGRGRQ